MSKSSPSHFRLPDWLRLMRSVAAFGLFATVVYVVLLLAVGTLCFSAAESDSLAAIWLRQLPRNLMGKTSQFAGMLQTRLDEANQISRADILVIGSSHAYRGFDPRLFAKAGLTLFNLGSSNQSHLQTRVLLQRYLNRIHPRLLIYEVYPDVFTLDGVESALDLALCGPVDRYAIRMLPCIPNMKVWNTLIFSLYRNRTGLIPRHTESRQQAQDTYVAGGYVEHHGPRRPPPPHSDQPPPTEKRCQQRAFENNIRLIRESGIPLLLVQAPTPGNSDTSSPESLNYARRMKTFAPYLDGNSLTDLDPETDFYDSNHLNQKGVDRFNQALIRRIFPNGQRIDLQTLQAR